MLETHTISAIELESLFFSCLFVDDWQVFLSAIGPHGPPIKSSAREQNCRRLPLRAGRSRSLVYYCAPIIS